MSVCKGIKNTEMYLSRNRAQMSVITEDACQNPLQVLDMQDMPSMDSAADYMPNFSA